MIKLLQNYISQLQQVDKASKGTARNRNSSYYMPNDLVTPEEWTGFDNVYQVHSPHIIMDNAIRDVRPISTRATAVSDYPPDHDAILLLLSVTKRVRVSYGSTVSVS